MKKALISLGALVFTGALLASCSTSSASSIKKPNKGKKVNEVSFKTYDGNYDYAELSFKSSDSFEDVMKALIEMPSLSYTVQKDTSDEYRYAYTSKKISKTDITSKNYYIASNGPTLAEKYAYLSENSATEDVYINESSGESKEEVTVYEKRTSKSNLKLKYGNYLESDSESYEAGRAGTKTITSVDGRVSERKVDGGRYRLENNKSTSNKIEGKTSGSVNNKDYEYLNGSEKATDDNYGKTYKGYDDSGNVYSYTYNTFLSSSFLSQYKTKPSLGISGSSVYLRSFYNEDFKDLYKGSVELTDKYIVLKFDTTYMYDIYADAARSASDKDEVKTNYNKLINGDYKGSKASYEIWIDYVTEVDDEGDVDLSYGYAKASTNVKLNRKAKYDDDYINDYHVSESDAAIIKGKEYTLKGSMTQLMEIAINSNDYSKKIDSMKKLCKKNNVLDKITMSVYDTGL